MGIEIKLTKEMESKGFPGTALLDKDNNVVSYDRDFNEALKQAEKKGYSIRDVCGMWIPDPDKTYIFATA